MNLIENSSQPKELTKSEFLTNFRSFMEKKRIGIARDKRFESARIDYSMTSVEITEHSLPTPAQTESGSQLLKFSSSEIPASA